MSEQQDNLQGNSVAALTLRKKKIVKRIKKVEGKKLPKGDRFNPDPQYDDTTHLTQY